MTDLDSSGDDVLCQIADDYDERGVELYLANVKGIILDVMRRSGFYERLGADHFFVSTHDAVRQAQRVIEDREIDLDAEVPAGPTSVPTRTGPAPEVSSP